jgi:hypothetical protein
MNLLRKVYLPNLCISYTLVVLTVSALNLFSGNNPNSNSVWPLQLGLFLFIVGVVDYFINKIMFKNWIFMIAVEYCINYMIFLLAAYYLHWIGFRPGNVILFTFIFTVIYVATRYHSYQMYKQEDDKINQILQQRNKE